MSHLVNAYMYPPRALARWVCEGRTRMDLAFYTALYSAGWIVITALIPLMVLLMEAPNSVMGYGSSNCPAGQYDRC